MDLAGPRFSCLRSTTRANSKSFLEWVLGRESEWDFSQLRVISGLDEGEITESAVPRRIEGFERDGESFGGATAFCGRIRVSDGDWEDCAILIPDLTRHTSTAEVISGAFLRESLPCSDGDIVEIDLN